MAVDSLTRWVIVMVLYSQVALRTGDCQTKWSRAVLVQLGDKLHGWPARVCVQYHFFSLGLLVIDPSRSCGAGLVLNGPSSGPVILS